ERQHRMRRVAKQHDAPTRPLIEPGPAEQSPLEQLTQHRPGNDGPGAFVEARELLEELVQRRRDVPALRFPLVPLRYGDEVQQFAAPDEIAVDVPALAK